MTNPLLSGAIGTFSGCAVFINDLMTRQVPHPRSLGRSRRRARLGHRQHYVTIPSQEVIRMPDGSLIMHSASWELLKLLKANATIDKPPGERPPTTGRVPQRPSLFGVTIPC